MDFIDYRQLPPVAGGFSDLYLDYVTNFPSVRKFYPYDYRDDASYKAVLQRRLQQPLDRTTLVEVLKSQNALFGSSARTFENIERLRHPSTFAVVTGQQVGLFGGPLYSLLKSMTAIKLAEHLSEKFPEHDFVPVFWLEGEDHDLVEMNHCFVLDQEGKPSRVEFLPGGVMPERNPGPVGDIVFDASLDESYSVLSAALQKTEFTQDLVQRLRESYTLGKTFTVAFASWMNSLLGQSGLVFLSSNTPPIKRLVSAIFTQEFTNYPQASQIIINRSAELEERYHAQVKPKSVNLLLFHKGGRYPIEPREDDFSLKGTRHFISREEALRIAQETPELLSPNVVLRPIVQDTVLPTVAYVAGPGEISYFAQIAPLYDHFGAIPPVIYPRASVTILDERVRRALDKYDLDILELFGDASQLTTKVISRITDVNVDQMFAQTSRQVHQALTELKFGLRDIDQTLIGALDGTTSKIDVSFGVLKEKALAAQKRRHETAVRQVERAITSLLPNGSLQERQLSLIHFMNKYGPDVVQWLSGELSLGAFQHQVLEL